MDIGQHHQLEILRETSVGLFLGNDDSEEVLLPNKYCPDEFEIGDMLEVFVYLDYAERPIATNLIPKIKLNEFAFLKVSAVNEVGAFMDWGLEKQLLVPYSEQRERMKVDRWYVVILRHDEVTNRLFASNKISKYIQNDALTIDDGEKVSLIVYKKTDLGYAVIIDHLHEGLIYNNEIFREINIGDKLDGYVKNIREDNKVDISLQAIGFENYNDANTQLILDKLTEEDGYLKINDKSTPEMIYFHFGISKKAFKKSIGSLYKQKKIVIEKQGIRIVSPGAN